MISDGLKAKLIWQCRRGMLELDLILNRFLDSHLLGLSDKELAAFEQVLTSPDPVLYAWLMGTELPTNQEMASIVTLIRDSHSFS